MNVLPGQPASQNLDDIVDLLLCERPALRDMVPFGQAAPAAGAGCVLSDKYRVVPHRRLLAVISRLGIGQPLGYKIPGVLENCRQALVPEILSFVTGKPKPAAKLRPTQSSEKLIHITHLSFLISAPDPIQSQFGQGIM